MDADAAVAGEYALPDRLPAPTPRTAQLAALTAAPHRLRDQHPAAETGAGYSHPTNLVGSG